MFALCNSQFFVRIILVIYYVCLYVFICDYLSLCVFFFEISGLWLKKGILVILDLGVFWSFSE